MHKRYIDFRSKTSPRLLVRGRLKMLTQMVDKIPPTRQPQAQALDFPYGEGRCPVVPLVFKTSLGVVRSPEGSTPSLLRQNALMLRRPHVGHSACHVLCVLGTQASNHSVMTRSTSTQRCATSLAWSTSKRAISDPRPTPHGRGRRRLTCAHPLPRSWP
jgi:hypothetical protein